MKKDWKIYMWSAVFTTAFIYFLVKTGRSKKIPVVSEVANTL